MSKPLLYLLSIIGFIGLWQLLSLYTHPLVLSSPLDTVKAFYGLLLDRDFYTHFWLSLQRVGSGVAVAGMMGISIALIAFTKPYIEVILEPFRWVLMSISPVVVVIFAMLWFGLGSAMVVFLVSILLIPVVYVNTLENLKAIDKEFIEVAIVYRLNLMLRLRYIYIPAIIPSLIVSFIYLCAMGVRVSILAEVLGANDGIGYALSNARINLEIAELFALAIVTLIMVSFFENLIVGYIKKCRYY